MGSIVSRTKTVKLNYMIIAESCTKFGSPSIEDDYQSRPSVSCIAISGTSAGVNFQEVCHHEELEALMNFSTLEI